MTTLATHNVPHRNHVRVNYRLLHTVRSKSASPSASPLIRIYDNDDGRSHDGDGRGGSAIRRSGLRSRQKVPPLALIAALLPERAFHAPSQACDAHRCGKGVGLCARGARGVDTCTVIIMVKWMYQAVNRGDGRGLSTVLRTRERTSSISTSNASKYNGSRMPKKVTRSSVLHEF